MQKEVFAESSQFAAEAIGAFRTVTALTLEERIAGRYERLLWGHVKKAGGTARWASLVYAIADALPLLCMALVFVSGCDSLEAFSLLILLSTVVWRSTPQYKRV